MLDASRPMMCTDYELSSTRVGMESVEGETDIQRLCSSGSEVEPRDDSPPTASPFTLSTSFEEDILDLKWWQSQSVDLKCTSHLTHPLNFYFISSFLSCYIEFSFFLSLPTHFCVQMNPQSFKLEGVYSMVMSKFTPSGCVHVCVCVRMILCLLYRKDRNTTRKSNYQRSFQNIAERKTDQKCWKRPRIWVSVWFSVYDWRDTFSISFGTNL